MKERQRRRDMRKAAEMTIGKVNRKGKTKVPKIVNIERKKHVSASSTVDAGS